MSALYPLIQIAAEAIDPDAFKADATGLTWEMRRRSASARARAGVRIAQALGWRFIPPGEFQVLGEDQLDEHCDRAKAHMREAADLLERK